LFEKKEFELISCKVDHKTQRNKVTNIIYFSPSADYLKKTESGYREILGKIFYLTKV
jgi:hypothetical protein